MQTLKYETGVGKEERYNVATKETWKDKIIRNRIGLNGTGLLHGKTRRAGWGVFEERKACLR